MKKIVQLFALVAMMAIPWATNAQFCTPSPSSKDGDGITNVVFGVGSEIVNSAVSWSAAPYYIDNSSMIGAVPAGTTCEMSVTFATGYTYGYIVWVDWDGNSTFSGTEVVCVGTAPNTSPVTVAAEFDIPTTQDTGTYLMRICAADSYFDSYTGSVASAAGANPCDSYSWGVALDYTLRVLEAPSCARPESYSISGITSDGATLNLVDNLNTGASYSIEYWKAGSDDTNTVTATTTSYTFTGLDANSLYYFAVKAVCSASDESLPLNGSFTTACDGSTCDLTAYVTDQYNDSWNGCSINIVQAGVVVGTIECPSGQSGSTFTYEVCSSAPVEFTFVRGSYPNELGGYIQDGGGNTVYTISNMGNYYTGDSLGYVAVPCPSCIPPTALTVLPDSNEITFSWSPRSGASQFIVYLNDSIINDNVSDTFYVFTGLNANTPYTVGVQSVCSADDSSSIVSYTTRTACGQITLPYFVDFEDAAYNGAWYPCWDSTIHAGTDPSVNNVRNHTAGGQYGLYLQATSAQNYNLVVSPQIPTAGDNIYVRFWAYRNNGWIKAGVMTNPHDTSTFIPMVTIESASGWNEYEFRTDTLDANATYYVAWLAYSTVSYSTNQIGEIDDIYISEAPSCARVPEVSIDTATTDAITLSWADNGSNSYTVYYWANGSVDTLTASTTDTTVTLSGLSAMTGYNMMVVANCSGGDAEPSPVYSAATACADVTCNMVVDATDTYGDGWNGNTIEFYQAGTLVGSATINSGNSATVPVEVCASAAVELRFLKGSFANEMGGTVTDGGGNVVFTIDGMSSYNAGDVLATVANPCPNCVPPSSVYLSDTTAAGVTIHWTPQSDQTAWIVRVDNNYYNVTDTFYTATGLPERTTHTIGVATDCSGDTSNFVTISFITGCANGECEITVTSTDEYGYGSYYSPKLHVYQNGAELAAVQYATETVGVCSGMPVNVIYEAPEYTYSTPMATIVNGGDEEVFNGATSSYSTGDTLVYMANACPSCLKPAGVMPLVIDSNQITFTWTVEAGYTYLISFDDGAYTTNNTGVYTAYGLTSNTMHTFAVKTVCSASDTSNPRVISVKTACGEMAIPYIESFESDAFGEVPSCWTVVSNGENGYPSVDDNGHTGEKSLTLVSTSSNTAMIASSRIPLPGDSIKVSFWAYKSYGYGTFEVGMMTNPYVDSTFTSLITVNSSSYELYEFNTNTLSHDSSYYLAFRYDYTGTYYYAKVDDINITLDEGCMTPTSVVATPSTTTSNVTVTWSCAGTLTDFVVQYREYGATTWSLPQYTSSLSKTLTGLNSSTTYEIRVGQLCGSDTLWASTVTATTLCGQVLLPYEENFVSATGTLPPCWDFTNSTYFHWNRWTTHAETSGDGEMMVGSGSAGEAAIMPTFYAPIIKLQISFKAKLGNVSEGDGIMMGAYNESTSTVEWIDTLTNPSQSRENFVVFTYNYLNYTGTGTRIAIGHSHNNPSDWGFAIDSIVVIELNSCNPPENLTAHNTMYPNTADDVYFTWTVSTAGTYVPSEWQLYIDTITSTTSIDSVPESQLISVDTTYYMPPLNTLAEGAHYRLFVRSKCGLQHSDWVELQNGFSTDEFWMRDTVPADTIIGCDFIIYDNGGPVAGYGHNSNSTLVIQAGEAGRELQLQGGFFSHGADANSFTVYDGIGVGGTVLYSRNVTNVTETIDSVLATSTTGAMTITFTSGYYAALGYELYIHCVGEASCTKPTNLQVEMVDPTTAYATWDSTGASLYRVYHHTSGDSVWNMNPTYTNSITLSGLPIDVNYDFYVVAYCSTTDTSAPSIIRHFNTHWEAPCYTPENLQVTNVDGNGASLSWTSTGTLWDVAIVGGATVRTDSNPYVFTDLTANTQYCVRVRNVCDTLEGRYSEWSDTLCFTTQTTYTITVTSNNEAWGTVTGGGTFVNGTTTVIKATPNSGYHFVSWQDNDTNAERTITVTGDATYTATFAAGNGIDDVVSSDVTLYPNPATAAVTISGIDGESIVTVVDLNGREVYKANANSSLTIDLTGYAKGAYFVRITGERTAAIRKLIVK